MMSMTTTLIHLPTLLFMILAASHYTAASFTIRLQSLSHSDPVLRRPSLHVRNARPSNRKRKSWTAHERDTILGRDGEYFKLDRMRGKIEFGSSSLIRTSLDGSDDASIRRWLSNDDQIAMSIWDPKLIKEIE